MQPNVPIAMLHLHFLRVYFALGTTTGPAGLEPAHACRAPNPSLGSAAVAKYVPRACVETVLASNTGATGGIGLRQLERFVTKPKAADHGSACL